MTPRTIGLRLLIAVALVAVGLLSRARPAQAASFQVASTDDAHRSGSAPAGICASDSAAYPPGGPCTLRAAIETVNALGGGPHTIEVPAGTYNITLGSMPDISDGIDLTISGAGSGPTIIDGGLRGGRFFYSDTKKQMTIRGVTFQRFGPSDYLYSVLGTGSNIALVLTLDDVVLTANKLQPLRMGGQTTLKNVRVVDNPSGIYGIASGGALTGTNVTVSGNTLDGPAIASIGGGGPTGILFLYNSLVANNVAASGTTGGIETNGVTVMSNVTVTGNVSQGKGACSGGICIDGNYGSATLTNVTVVDNKATSQTSGAGGINVATTGGAFTMTNGLVQGNNGAIGGMYLSIGSSPFMLSATSVLSNTGGTLGGGIREEGSGSTLTLRDVIVAGNTITSTDIAAGIQDGGHGASMSFDRVTVSGNTGGGISMVNATNSQISNTTVSGNTGFGFRRFAGGDLTTLTNVTIADNGGIGVDSANVYDKKLNLQNVLLADNTGGNCGGEFFLQSLGSNLSTDRTCAPYLTAAGDLNGVAAHLAPLANNGGTTQTRALLPGSPAIDTVMGGCPPPSADQRGISRPQGAHCDIGAFETTDLTTPAVSVSVTKSLTSTTPVTVTAPISNQTAWITFDGLDTGGTVVLGASSQPLTQTTPSGLTPLGTTYEVTNSGVGFSSARLCLTYSLADLAGAIAETTLRLMHSQSGTWQDITEAGSPDTTNHVICGRTSSFSPFVIAGKVGFKDYLPVVVDTFSPGW